MIKYQNISSHPLTFYGVTFNPNATEVVPGFINHPKMIRVWDTKVKKPTAIINVAEPKVEEKVEKSTTRRPYNRKKSNQ